MKQYHTEWNKCYRDEKGNANAVDGAGSCSFVMEQRHDESYNIWYYNTSNHVISGDYCILFWITQLIIAFLFKPIMSMQRKTMFLINI